MPASTSDLVRREGVELIRTGSWAISSGSWNPTPQDIAAAVAAQNCPAVRRPVIKLGHTDARFTPGDGEPALGWFENLRPGDGGHTLVADQVTLPWLDKVQAAAYPDRSVEGLYNFKCQLSHTHPFVLTAVALLGVTPPGIGTLKSLNDVKGLFTVAATEAAEQGARPVSLTVHAGRHGFEEGKHDRDNDGRFSITPGGDKDPDKGDAPGGAAKGDKLRVASRIKLTPGESLVGSDAAGGEDSIIPLAATRTADGVKLRIGTGILDEDKTRWSGADKGNTVVLDEDGIAHLVDALDEMPAAAERGQERLKALRVEVKDLAARQRDMVHRQYPDLSKAKARELDRLDQRIPETTARIALLDEQNREAADKLPAPAKRRWLELEAQASALLAHPGEGSGRLADIREEQAQLHHQRETGSRVGYAGLAARRQAELDGLRQTLQRDRERRAELTTDGRELSTAEAAELRSVTAELDRVQGDINALVDDGDLFSGAIPGEWGSLSYEAVMTESGPAFRLSARRAGDNDADTTTHLSERQVRRLGEMVRRLTMPEVAAAADENQLKRYWTKDPEGLAKWAKHPHPWTALYHHLRRGKGLTDEQAKRIASEWFHDVFGYWPGDRRHRKVAASTEDNMLTPESVRAAWNSSAPHEQWIVEIAPDLSHVVVVDDGNARSFARVPVLAGADGGVTFGDPVQVRPGYVEQAIAASAAPTVYASREESRPPDPTVEPSSSDPTHLPSVPNPAPPQPEVPAPTLPAAEPEPNTEPKEDPVSTDLSEFRSRLGLPDDADKDAILAALDAKLKAPAEPTPEMVAASAQAEQEKTELRKEVSVLASQVQTLSTKLAETEAEKAAGVKASVIGDALKLGKIAPTDKDQWEKDYDEAPGPITRVLASIHPGTAVPVAAAGRTGNPDVQVTDDDLMKAFFSPEQVATFEKTEA